jgi:hypothetical protein
MELVADDGNKSVEIRNMSVVGLTIKEKIQELSNSGEWIQV